MRYPRQNLRLRFDLLDTIAFFLIKRELALQVRLRMVVRPLMNCLRGAISDRPSEAETQGAAAATLLTNGQPYKTAIGPCCLAVGFDKIANWTADQFFIWNHVKFAIRDRI